MRRLIREAHAGQTRLNGRVPYWPHCENVAEILEEAFGKTGELADDPACLEDLVLAALGHDLYEDTDVDRRDIRRSFSRRVDRWIEGMTNPHGDEDRAAYVAQIREAPEEVKLIKIADLIENTLTVAYGIQDLGIPWTESFFLPIVEEMAPVVTEASYTRYPKTAALLLPVLAFALERLRGNLRRFREAEDKNPASESPSFA